MIGFAYASSNGPSLCGLSVKESNRFHDKVVVYIFFLAWIMLTRISVMCVHIKWQVIHLFITFKIIFY